MDRDFLYVYLQKERFFFVFGSNTEGEKVKKVNSMAIVSNLFSKTQYNGRSPSRFSIQHIQRKF